MTSELYKHIKERDTEMIDEYNSSFFDRIKKVEEEIKLVEIEIVEAEKVGDYYHQKQLMRLVDHKENKIEVLKRNLINE